MSCDNQNYWFNVPMDSNFYPDLYDDVVEKRIGILNSNPQYTLDVNGTTQTTNLIVPQLIQSSNILNTALIETQYLTTDEIQASNVTTHILDIYNSNYSSNTTASNTFQHTTFINGYDLSRPFPDSNGNVMDDVDWWFTDRFMDRPIHPSWLQDPHDAIQDIYNAANAGVDVLNTLTDVAGFLFPPEEGSAIPEAMINALADALSGGNDDPSSTDSNSIYCSWSNLIDKPIAFTGQNAGLKGDLYISACNSLYSIDDNYIAKGGRNNLSILPNGQLHSDKILDFKNKILYTNDIELNSNFISPYINFGDSNSNVNVAGSRFSSNSTTSRIDTTVVQATQLVDNVFDQSKLYYYGLGTAITHIRPPSTSNLDGARFNLDPYSMKFQTSSNNVSFNSYKTLMSMDSVGSLYVASNITSCNELLLKATSNDNEGILEFSPDKLRFRASNAVSVSNLFGINSNGAFFESTLFPRLYGRVEGVEYANPVDPLSNISMSNFARLEFSFSNGLKFGTGLSNNIFNAPYPNLDFFTISRLGELSTLAQDTVTMEKHINSNGEIQKSNTIIDKQGNYKVKGSNVILSDGTLRRRANPSNVAGWQVSSNGVVTQGNTEYRTDGSIYNTISSNRMYNASNETLSCEFLGIGTSNPLKDLHIQSVDSFGNPPEEVGIRIQSGDNLEQSHLHIASMEGIQSTIGFYNKPLKIGRTSNVTDVTGTTQSTMVFAMNDNIGIKKLVPSYDLEVGGVTGTVGACNFYESGKQLSEKYVALNGGDITSNLSLSNKSTLEFGKFVTGKELNAGKIGYTAFTTDALDIVGAGSNLSGRKIQLWDNVNTYGTISEAGTLLSTKYASSNTLSNYLLKLQPETTATFKSIAGPGGLQNGLIVDNTNVNYGSGSAIILSTGSNWRGRLYQDTQGDGNHMKISLSSGGNSNFVTGLDIGNFGGNIRGTIANLYVNDFGFGTNSVGIAHSAVTSNAYALLTNELGYTFLNCASNAGIFLTQNRTSNIAYFTNKDWGIGSAITGQPDAYTGQGGGPFTKTGGWKVVQNVGGTWCADVECYAGFSGVGIFPNSSMTNNAYNGTLNLYFSGGSNAIESAMCTYYITNIYSYGIQCYLKSKDERNLTLGTTGLVGTDTIRTTVSEEYIAFSWRFDGAA
jgi:hypothetical protein